MYKRVLKTITSVTLLSGALLGTAGSIALAQGKVDTDFRDVPKTHWAYPAINDLAERNIIAGYGDGIFGFGDVATREQVAGLIYRVLFPQKQGGAFKGKGYVLSDGSNLRNPYGDIDQGSTIFPEEILTLTKVGVFKGDENGNFRPKASVSRAEMAQILTNAFSLSAKHKHTFKDVPSDFWGENAISAVQTNGIARGTGGANFEPANKVTREQYAQFLYNALEFKNGKTEVVHPTNDSKVKEESKEIVAFKQGVQKYLGNEVLDFTVPFQGKNENKEEVKNTLMDKAEEVLKQNDYLDFNHSKAIYWISGSSGDYKLRVQVHMRETKEQTEYVRQQSKVIVQSLVHNGMSEYEKVKAVHDYVVKHVSYDMSSQSYTAYEALVNRSAVCHGYSLLTYQLLKDAGMEVRIVRGTGNGGKHSWNLVKINNKWFHIDTTWDDPIPDKPGRVSYKYFVVSDKQLAKNHNWERSLYPQANTEYSSMTH
ncbi:hypothetical protein B4086_5551 [Bacillus cereus]|nr:hypothetical protein B4086_5551 [Bacillus cereus]